MRNAFKYRLDLTDYCFNEWNEPKFKKKTRRFAENDN